jgi:hypothetical protein
LFLVCTRVGTVCSLFPVVVSRPRSDNFHSSVYIYIYISTCLLLVGHFCSSWSISSPPLPLHGYNLPLSQLGSLMSCRWRQHFSSWTFGTQLPDYTVLWPTELWYESLSPWKSHVYSFLFSFQAGQSVGWHFAGAGMNLKVFRICTTSIIPAGQQVYFSSCTYCLVIYFHASCQFVWCACPMAPVHAVTVVLVSFLTHAYAGFSLFAGTAFVCLIRCWLLAQLSNFCQSIRFSYLLQVALYLNCTMTGPVSGMGEPSCRPVRRTEGRGKPTLVIWAKNINSLFPKLNVSTCE